MPTYKAVSMACGAATEMMSARALERADRQLKQVKQT